MLQRYVQCTGDPHPWACIRMPLDASGLNGCLYRHNAEMRGSLPSQALLLTIMIGSSCCSRKCNRNSGCRFLYNHLPKILGRSLYTRLHPPTIGLWWSWVVRVMAPSDCYSWGNSLFDTFWVSHKVLTAFSLVMLVFSGTHTMVAFKVLLWSSLCNPIDMDVRAFDQFSLGKLLCKSCTPWLYIICSQL